MLTVAEAGRRGGKARLKKMTAEERQEVARNAVKVRYSKMTAAQRKEAARKAAQARWKREKKQKSNA